MRWLLLLLPLLLVAEPLTYTKVLELLGRQNPFVLLRSLQMLRSEALVVQRSAPYDLSVDFRYEKKEYPLSRSLYMEGGAKKLFEKGVEFGVKWRKASGTQEYNNIKTGADGEYVAQIKLHLNALIEGMGAVDIQKEMATLEALRQKRLFKEQVNSLIFEVLALYNEAIGLEQRVAVVRERLEKIVRLKGLFEQKLKSGVVSKQEWLGLKEWKLSQRQALVRLQALLKRRKRELGLFLHLKAFTLPKALTFISLPPFQEAVKIALRERGSIQELAIKAKQQKLALKEAKLQRFGKLEASLYGVYDVKYEKEGAKGVVRFALPLQRRFYRAKSELAKISQLGVQTKRALLERTIQTRLANFYSDLDALQKEKRIVTERKALLEQIVALEYQKFKEGVGDLFSYNQKLVQLYTVQEDLLDLRKKIALKQLEIEREMGRIGRD